MQIAGFHHIALPVTNIEVSEKWYCDVFGGVVIVRMGWDARDVRSNRTRQIWVQIGKDILALAEAEKIDRPTQNHFWHHAFAGEAAELEQWLQHLERLQVKALGPYGHGGSEYLSIYFDDPDNYRHEICFNFGDYETARTTALKYGGKLGNPVQSYEWV